MNLKIKLPTQTTLNKYGLTEKDWIELYKSHGGICPICERPLDTRVCVDHHHVKGFRKMKPEQKKKYVRGLLHWVCNHYYLGRGITIQRARNVVIYLEKFEKKINNDNRSKNTL